MDIIIKISVYLISFLFFIQGIKAFKNKKIAITLAYFSEPDVIIEGFLARLLSVFTILGCILLSVSVTISTNTIDWSDKSILSTFLFILGVFFLVLPRYVVLIWEANR